MEKSKLLSAVEMPVELIVNDKVLATFMATPQDLDELAIGHLLTRGLIKDISSIEDINVDSNTYQIFVTTKDELPKKLYNVPEIIVSGTSSVDKFSDSIYEIPKIENDFSVQLSKIIEIANIMNTQAPIYNTTGGVHAAVIMNVEKDRYFLREDIGRHCAVDKAVGAAAKEGVDLSNTFICTTGRISLDMLLKSAVVQIPVVSSLKYPSDMGVKLGDFYGISIVARILSKEALIYTHEERIIK